MRAGMLCRIEDASVTVGEIAVQISVGAVQLVKAEANCR
jgi:hypothetical protein